MSSECNNDCMISYDISLTPVFLLSAKKLKTMETRIIKKTFSIKMKGDVITSKPNNYANNVEMLMEDLKLNKLLPYNPT